MSESEPKKEESNWFWRLLRNVLQSYSRNINLEFFQRKYPGLPAEVVAKRRIKIASNNAGLIGFCSGAVISIAGIAVVAETLSTFASGFTSSPVTIPALLITAPIGILSFAGEVTALVRLQLHLAYDLFVLYGLPVNTEDPEQMQEIVAVAFGIKATEVAGQAIQKIIPQLAPALLRNKMRKDLVRKRFQEWVAQRGLRDFANKYLAEGALIRFLVPGIPVILATAWDYLSTQAIGQALQARIRRRGLAAKRVDKLSLEGVENPELILQAVLCLAMTNDELSETEIVFYSKLVEKLQTIYGSEFSATLEEISSLDWDDLVTDLADVENTQEKLVIYNALTEVAIVEGEIQAKKVKRLKIVAKLFGLPFDLSKIKKKVAAFKVPHRSRTFLIGILILFVLTIILCLIVSISVWPALLQ